MSEGVNRTYLAQTTVATVGVLIGLLLIIGGGTHCERVRADAGYTRCEGYGCASK